MTAPCVTFSGLTLKAGLTHTHTHTEYSVYSHCVSSPDINDWGVSPRGAGFLFGSDVVTQVDNMLAQLQVPLQVLVQCYDHSIKCSQCSPVVCVCVCVCSHSSMQLTTFV